MKFWDSIEFVSQMYHLQVNVFNFHLFLCILDVFVRLEMKMNFIELRDVT